jgi:Fe-S-cluster containining protein
MDPEQPIVACPGYCCFDLGPIRSGDQHVTLEYLHELAKDPQERGVRFFLERMMIPLGKDENGADHFSCNFFDTEKRLCTIYERRPNMCRGFPYGGACPICTYDDRLPDVPGTLREEFLDPERLRAFVNRQRAR